MSAKVTWLTPYMTAWRIAGTPSAARMAKALKPIHEEVGQDRAVAALRAFLASGNARFGVEVFARAWREYDAQAQGQHLNGHERTALDALTSFTGEP